MSRRDLAEAGAVMVGAVVVVWAFIVAGVMFPIWRLEMALLAWRRGRGG